ncbi:SMR family transporter [Burkholderia sp. Ac-20353]|uniref:SMR family transporter n=1 Tax=Burkholderia sp. Ac-20353 TaxID=2703894 RepID=UPI00197BAE08|nr:QacE family quaternary ammonium compound efflux SMR transporter [Burkholderia sp. Ac-20353]
MHYAQAFQGTADLVLPAALTVIAYLAAVWLMALATTRIEMGLAYAVWAGGSTAATTVVGILCFGESAAPLKLVGLALAVGSLAALNAAGDGR